MKILLAKKIGMTQIWDDAGRLKAATVLLATPNKLYKEGAKQQIIAHTSGKTNKPQSYLAKELGSEGGIKVKTVTNIEQNDGLLTVDQFVVGEKLKITGTTKGKGFAGTIKRHNFHRGPVSHGSDNIRQPGSIGAQRPQRVVKGQKMAGHMGNVTFTARGNKVLAIKSEENLIIVSGAVPGPVKGDVVIQSII